MIGISQHFKQYEAAVVFTVLPSLADGAESVLALGSSANMLLSVCFLHGGVN